MEFKVNSGMWGMMFGVPCIVADNFLKLASEAQIKTLIYILRNNNRICTSEEISRAVGITSEQADEAILFWEQANLLSS
ncbi:MAG: DnaD domain protein, partial [Ruminococcus sp.]|nr:DnaD domain protein [Ruminococcus sp.]